MNSALKNLYNTLEKQRSTYVQWVQAKPAESLQNKSAPGQWSAAQVVYHLSLIDHLVVHSLEKTISEKKALKPAKMGTGFRSLLLSIALKLPIKFKAPKVLGEMPDRIDVPKVIHRWQESREKLQKILDTFPEELLGKEIFFHPRAGKLTIKQTLSFLLDHHRHHHDQLKRALG